MIVGYTYTCAVGLITYFVGFGGGWESAGRKD
jgi:hypothetical protein